ncbi:translation initiation factor IF-2-like [Sciurus carolinensis]|uniref:translation initiation factor IF-2-like n=1 Tax=Sciurus carolinensis TaxID=30640 RepID=UPI001FB3A7EA|nr:translation initiation factor IF-2-like [Sciurus carolinensis]
MLASEITSEPLIRGETRARPRLGKGLQALSTRPVDSTGSSPRRPGLGPARPRAHPVHLQCGAPAPRSPGSPPASPGERARARAVRPAAGPQPRRAPPGCAGVAATAPLGSPRGRGRDRCPPRAEWKAEQSPQLPRRQAAPRLGAVLRAGGGGGGGPRPMGGAGGGAGPCGGAGGGQRAPPARRISRVAGSARRGAPWEPAAPGRAALTRRAGAAPARRRARGGRGASLSGDEERVAHPAPKPAAAGRLHCLTAPGRPCPDLQIQETHPSEREENCFLRIIKEDWHATRVGNSQEQDSPYLSQGACSP